MKKQIFTIQMHPVYEVADGSITFKNVDFSYKKDSAEKVSQRHQSGDSFRSNDWNYRRNRKCEDKSGQSDQPSV